MKNIQNKIMKKLKKYSSFEELKAEDNNQLKPSEEEIKKRHDEFCEFIEILRKSEVLTKK